MRSESRGRSVRERWRGAMRALRDLREDLRAASPAGSSGAGATLRALGDSSVWALALYRGSVALRSLVGTSLGTRGALRVLFHLDFWTDDVGPGLRLPHPFCIVVGDGVTVGPGCTLMHGVTLQRGATTLGAGVVLADHVTVLAGSQVGAGSLVGSHSVVRGAIAPASVAVGAPARVLRSRQPEVRA